MNKTKSTLTLEQLRERWSAGGKASGPSKARDPQVCRDAANKRWALERAAKVAKEQGQ